MKISHVILIIISVVFVSSCNHVGVMAVVNPPPIIVHVNNAGVAGITTPASGKCKVSNQGKPGCLHFDPGETGLVNFKRTGPPAWSFSTFQICKMTDAGNICDLNIWERMDFAVTDDAGTVMLVPDESGLVDLSPLGNSLDAFILLNLNTIAQDYYYSVTVCRAPDDCDIADPPVENGGKH